MYGYKTFHPKLAQSLIDSVRSDTASHAYIFEGSKGMYKTETARLFANALVCAHQSTAPCGECASCRQAMAKSCPDIIIVEHDKGKDGKPKKKIGVAAARETNADALIKPFAALRKVYIVPDGENLTTEAQNALLKTLEEPPEYVVFIIIIPSASQLLQTIISRSTVITFNAVAADTIYDHIIEKYPEKRDRAAFITAYSDGVPGAADALAADDSFDELRGKCLFMIERLLSKDAADAFKIEDFVSENADRVNEICDIWISLLRDISVLHCGRREAVINSDKIDALRALMPKADLKRCIRGAELLVESEEMLSKSVKANAVMLRCALMI